MTLEVVLAILGIALTIYFGALGARAVKRRNQKQIAKGDGTNIQSGRDTNIGRK